MKRLTTIAAATTALSLLSGCASMPNVSQWQMPWQGGGEADQEQGEPLAKIEVVSQAIGGVAGAVLAASDAAANGFRADARCITPRPVMQFAGDHRCDQPDPVWSAASHQDAVTRAEGSPFAPSHMAAYQEVATKVPSPRSAQRSGVDRMARAWSRYCDSGRGMTDEDWSLVAAAGESAPDHLKSTCIPPK